MSEILTENPDLKHQLAKLTAANVSLCSQLAQQDHNIQALNKSIEEISLMLTKIIESQPANGHRSKLSQHFNKYVAPHVKNCQVFEDGEKEMEVSLHCHTNMYVHSTNFPIMPQVKSIPRRKTEKCHLKQ